MRNAIFLAMLLAGALAPSAAAMPAQAGPCLDLRSTHTRATFSGRLTVRLFAQAFERDGADQSSGDDTALILQLPGPACAIDGLSLDPGAPFEAIEVKSDLPKVLKALKAAVGQQVTISGEAFGAFGPIYRAPLVLVADRVDVR